MKDILGNDVNIGDTVVFNPPHYKGLTIGKVIKETPKGLRVEYKTGSNLNLCETIVFDFVKANKIEYTKEAKGND